ncbi:MAG TPA: hypothetical protein VGJ45_35220 [Pseudonocardiaceae bacterium]
MYSKPGPWHLPLRGTPCASCGAPAARLTVFGAERVVIHQDGWPPCRLPAHAAPTPDVADLAFREHHPRQAA